MLFVCYPKCTTCQKAKKWLTEKGISFEERDIKTENPTKEELEAWYKKSGLPLKRFFNTSGILYLSLIHIWACYERAAGFYKNGTSGAKRGKSDKKK